MHNGCSDQEEMIDLLLGIKDSKIKQMQYKLSHIEKSDSLTLPDTIFVNSFKLDTIMGDEWANNHIIMSYPNKIKITGEFSVCRCKERDYQTT